MNTVVQCRDPEGFFEDNSGKIVISGQRSIECDDCDPSWVSDTSYLAKET